MYLLAHQRKLKGFFTYLISHVPMRSDQQYYTVVTVNNNKRNNNNSVYLLTYGQPKEV